MQQKPWKVGWSESTDKFGKERVRKHQLKLSAAANLTDLSEEYAFYTPALLYLKVPLHGRDLFQAFLQEYGKDVLPLSVRLNRPIFQGLDVGPHPDWNYLLFAMEREHWKAFFPWMRSLTFRDQGARRIFRTGDKPIRIADPIFFERAVVLPREIPCIEVAVFCVDGSDACYYLEEGQHPLLDLPRLRREEPFEDTRKLGAAMLKNHPRPFDVIERQPEEDVIDRVREARKRQKESDG